MKIHWKGLWIRFDEKKIWKGVGVVRSGEGVWGWCSELVITYNKFQWWYWGGWGGCWWKGIYRGVCGGRRDGFLVIDKMDKVWGGEG